MSCNHKRIKRRLLFSDENVRLEEIKLIIGSCRATIFREVVYGKIDEELGTQDFTVKEHKSIPEWYIRQMKLEALLITREDKLKQLLDE
jgi:hypothetical protein